MATNKAKPSKIKSTIKKTVAKKVVIDKKKTAKQILSEIKRKTTVVKSKKKSKVVVAEAKPIQLSTEREAQLAEWKAKEEGKDSFINVWGSKLNITKKKIQELNLQYRNLLYKNLQGAYEVYDNVVRSEYSDDFFSELRGGLYKQGFKIQSNTTDSALIIRYVFGTDTDAKTVSNYSYALDGAHSAGVDTKEFAQWLQRKTLTKVIEDHRAHKKEVETTAKRLDRARRIILRMLEIRETKPIVKFTRIERDAERMIGSNFGLCVMLGYAYRKFGRGDDALDVDINLNFLIPPSIDLEITIVDKLARYIIRDVEQYEKNISETEEQQWAEDVWERLVAGCDEEVERNREYWSNRQQAALAEDQLEFAKKVKERKLKKKKIK